MIRKIKQLGNGEKSSGRIWKFFFVWTHFIRGETCCLARDYGGGTLIISSTGENPGEVFAVIQIHRNKEFDLNFR